MFANMYELYSRNNEFKEYVDKYCYKHRLDVINALKCEMIKEVYKYYISEKSQNFQGV